MIYKKSTKVSNICQLVNANLFTPIGSDTWTYAGITVTKNISAGTITFNGTSTSNLWYHVHDAGSELKYTNLIKGYKYYISGMPVNDLGVVFQLTSLFNLQGEQVFTAPRTSDGTGAFNVYIPKGVTLTNFVVTPQLFDLTEMYGQGNEPTTVEEFKNRWYKNLFVPSTEIGTLSGWNQPTARQFEENKWYIGLTDSNYYLPGNVVEYELMENSIYVNTKGNGYGIARAFKCEPDTHYVVSWIYGDNTTDKSKTYVGIGYYDESGTYLTTTTSARNVTNVGFTTPGNCKWFTVDFTSITPNSLYVSNLQLEEGPTVTPYVPYTPNPAPYRPYCFIDSRKKAVKVSDMMQVISKPINGAGTELAGTTSTVNGITYNFLADGTGVTLTGTATYTSIVQYFTFWRPVSGHKYLWLYDRDNRGESTAYFEIKWTGRKGEGHWFDGTEKIYTLNVGDYGPATRLDFHVIVLAGQTCNGFTWHPQCFDLTEMYGQGNEPATVEEFKSRWYKNLCDWNRLLELPVDSSHANVGFYQVVIDVEPSTAYTLSRATGDVVTIPNRVCYLGMDNEDKNAHASNCWLNHNAIPSYCRKSITLTSSSEGKLWIFFSKSVYDVYEAGENIFGYLQLEKGSTATSYVPYTPNPAPYTPYSSIYSLASTVKVSDYCQFFDKSCPADVTRAGITLTNNGDGSVTINGTTTTTVFSREVCKFNIIKGHKYYVSGVNDTAATTYRLRIFNCTPVDCYKPSIITANMSIKTGAYVQVFANRTVDNVVVTPQFFDLTEMYGAGNEPNTVDEFTNRWYKNLFNISKVTSVRKWINQSWVLSPKPYGLVDNGYYLEQTVWSDGMGFPDVGFSLSAGTYTYSANVYTSWDNITLRILDTLSDKNIYMNNYQKIVDGKVTQTFTIDTDSEIYIGIVANGNKDNAVVKVTITNIQLEKGSTATGYVPYTPNPAPYKPHVFI